MREEELWELTKHMEEMTDICEWCCEKKERKDVDLCYRCAKRKAGKQNKVLTYAEYETA